MITLAPITEETYPDALKLAVRPDQEHLVASVQKSLADAYVYEASVFRLAYCDEVLVGYVLLFPFVSEGKRLVNIVRLMIDKDHQRKGHGRTCLQVVLEELATWQPPIDRIRISTLRENRPALDLYRSQGFVEEGIEEGEIALYLRLPAAEHRR